MNTSLDDAARKAFEVAPGSLRALAREAGVSLGLLQMIEKGHRRATPATAKALAAALERMAGRHAYAAYMLRQALTEEGEK